MFGQSFGKTIVEVVDAIDDRDIKSVPKWPVDEFMKAAKESSNSHPIKKKDEIMNATKESSVTRSISSRSPSSTIVAGN